MSSVAGWVRLVPPRPKIFVFRELSGYWACVEREPVHHGLFIGLSERLFREMRDHLRNYEDAKIEDRADVEYVQGAYASLPVMRPAMAMAGGDTDDFAPYDAPSYIEFVVRPREVERPRRR